MSSDPHYSSDEDDDTFAWLDDDIEEERVANEVAAAAAAAEPQDTAARELHRPSTTYVVDDRPYTGRGFRWDAPGTEDIGGLTLASARARFKADEEAELASHDLDINYDELLGVDANWDGPSPYDRLVLGNAAGTQWEGGAGPSGLDKVLHSMPESLILALGRPELYLYNEQKSRTENPRMDAIAVESVRMAETEKRSRWRAAHPGASKAPAFGLGYHYDEEDAAAEQADKVKEQARLRAARHEPPLAGDTKLTGEASGERVAGQQGELAVKLDVDQGRPGANDDENGEQDMVLNST